MPPHKCGEISGRIDTWDVTVSYIMIHEYHAVLLEKISCSAHRIGDHKGRCRRSSMFVTGSQAAPPG
jgi:hypothetical protein